MACLNELVMHGFSNTMKKNALLSRSNYNYISMMWIYKQDGKWSKNRKVAFVDDYRGRHWIYVFFLIAGNICGTLTIFQILSLLYLKHFTCTI